MGSIVGQLAKAFGCKVIGITSSEEKGRWLRNELDFDAYVNNKTEDVGMTLDKVAPNGVDIYFDTVRIFFP